MTTVSPEVIEWTPYKSGTLPRPSLDIEVKASNGNIYRNVYRCACNRFCTEIRSDLGGMMIVPVEWRYQVNQQPAGQE